MKKISITITILVLVIALIATISSNYEGKLKELKIEKDNLHAELNNLKKKEKERLTNEKLKQGWLKSNKTEPSEHELDLLGKQTPEMRETFYKLSKDHQDSLVRIYIYINEYNKHKENNDVKSLIELDDAIYNIFNPTMVPGWQFYASTENSLKDFKLDYRKIGLFIGNNSDIFEYSYKYILRQAHHIDPNSKYRDHTLLSTILTGDNQCTVFHVKLAEEYIDEFTKGKHTHLLTNSIINYYLGRYYAVWQLEEEVKVKGDIAYAMEPNNYDHLKLGDYTDQRKKFLNKAIVHIKKAIKAGIENEYIDNFSDLATDPIFLSTDEEKIRTAIKNLFQNKKFKTKLLYSQGCV